MQRPIAWSSRRVSDVAASIGMHGDAFTHRSSHPEVLLAGNLTSKCWGDLGTVNLGVLT
jgi:hypothetical protein